MTFFMRDSSVFIVDSNLFRAYKLHPYRRRQHKETGWFLNMDNNNKTNNHAKREEIKLKVIR